MVINFIRSLNVKKQPWRMEMSESELVCLCVLKGFLRFVWRSNFGEILRVHLTVFLRSKNPGTTPYGLLRRTQTFDPKSYPRLYSLDEAKKGPLMESRPATGGIESILIIWIFRSILNNLWPKPCCLGRSVVWTIGRRRCLIDAPQAHCLHVG